MSDLTLKDIYTNILNMGWFSVGEKDEVYKEIGDGKQEPFIALEKHVALPTRENLNRSGRDNLLIFHPLMEGVVGAESPIISRLRRSYSIRSNFCAAALFKYLLTCGSRADKVDKFSPDQMKLLTVINGVNEKAVRVWDKVVEASLDKNSGTDYFIRINTSRNDTLNGQSYSRVATVVFPIYQELIKNTDKIFNKTVKSIQMSEKERLIFIALFEYIFSGLKTDHKFYSTGTNSRIAPYLDVVLKTFICLFNVVNKHYLKFKDVIPMEESIYTDTSWSDDVEDIEGLKSIAQSVPQQFGNYSTKVEEDKRAATGSLLAEDNHKKSSNAPMSIGEPIKQPEIQIPNTGSGFKESLSAPADALRTEQKETFIGIGRPIEGANGSVTKTNVSLQADMVTSDQSRMMVDPKTAIINQVMETIKHGVGRVSATSANYAALNTGFINQPFGSQNQPLTGVNNGWNNTNNNGWNNNNQQVTASTAVIAREMALQRIMSNPGPFANSGSMLSNTKSSI